MVQAVDRRTVTTKSRVRVRSTPWEICGWTQVSLQHIFLRAFQCVPVSIIPPLSYPCFCFVLLFEEGRADEAWEHSNGAVLGYWRTFDRKLFRHYGFLKGLVTDCSSLA